MNDIWTMIWKETKDSVLQGGLSALIRPLLLIGILGIVLPLRLGLQWLALTPPVVGLVLYIPLTVILSFVGDAIAGERERHTLETLLASRISDRAILLGKIIVTTGYAWGTALIGLLLGLVVANLSKGQGSWEFYTHVDLLLEALALSLLASLLGVSGGVLISMRSATVRQAQQILIVATLVLVGGGALAQL
jgi:ABC-2 type transport system permease protein